MKKILLFLLFIVAFGCAGIFLIHDARKDKIRTKDFILTTGVVVDYMEDYDPVNNKDDDYYSYFDEDYMYAPIVEYFVDGYRYLAYSSEYTRNPPYIGTPINVYYNPDNHGDAVINKYSSNVKQVAAGYIFIGFSGLILLVGIFGGFREKEENKI